MSFKKVISWFSFIANFGSISLLKKNVLKIDNSFSKIFLLLPIEFASEIAESISKLTSNAESGIEVSYSLCFNCMFSGKFSLIYVFILFLASSVVNPDMSTPFIDTPKAILLLAEKFRV